MNGGWREGCDGSGGERRVGEGREGGEVTLPLLLTPDSSHLTLHSTFLERKEGRADEEMEGKGRGGNGM